MRIVSYEKKNPYIMSKSKKSIETSSDYSSIKDELTSSLKNLKDSTSELYDIVSSVFKLENPSEDELVNIKKEWIESSNKINSLDDTINNLSKEKNSIAKKMEDIINKKGKSNSTINNNLNALKEEWLDITNQITVINSQLETYNKERAKLIKKTELYFSKIDTVSNKVTKGKKEVIKKATTKNLVEKETTKKEVAKKAPAKKADATKKAKETKAKETKEVKAKETKEVKANETTEKEDDDSEEVSKEQIKLKLESDSESDTSESDTDSNLSTDSDDSSDSDDEEP